MALKVSKNDFRAKERSNQHMFSFLMAHISSPNWPTVNCPGKHCTTSISGLTIDRTVQHRTNLHCRTNCLRLSNSSPETLTSQPAAYLTSRQCEDCPSETQVSHQFQQVLNHCRVFAKSNAPHVPSTSFQHLSTKAEKTAKNRLYRPRRKAVHATHQIAKLQPLSQEHHE